MAETRADSATRLKTRATIVDCAARLLRERGAGGVTTRAVAQAAGMQAPTIYRFFEDKDALLDAVAERAHTGPVAEKARVEALKLARDPGSREQLQSSQQTMDLIKTLVGQAA